MRCFHRSVSGDERLQRWYRTFPHGLHGIGLLVLRLAIGAKLVVAASSCMLDPQGLKLGVWLLCLFALGMEPLLCWAF